MLLLLVVLAGTIHHAVTFGRPELRRYDINSTKELSDFVYQEKTDWAGIGKVLGDRLNHDPSVVIAVTAAGVIPYYSRLTAVDILGLNDPWVARYGEPGILKPGHQRRATFQYLLDRRVNLLIGHPQMVPINEPPAATLRRDYFYVRTDCPPADARIIEIPINPHYKLRVLYLNQNPVVDAAIATNGWVTYPINLVA